MERRAAKSCCTSRGGCSVSRAIVERGESTYLDEELHHVAAAPGGSPVVAVIVGPGVHRRAEGPRIRIRQTHGTGLRYDPQVDHDESHRR